MSNQYSQKIKSIVKQVEDLKQEYYRQIEQEIVNFFKEKSIKSVCLYVNNHEWNDGDETYFSVRYSLDEDTFNMVNDNKITASTMEEFQDLFEAFESIHEDFFTRYIAGGNSTYIDLSVGDNNTLEIN